MGKLAELALEMQFQISDGIDVQNIARNLKVPLEWVLDEYEYMCSSDFHCDSYTEVDSDDNYNSIDYV